MKRVLPGVLGLLLVAACTFAPDLSRYPMCDAQGACEAGWTCLTLESRCIPDCGERGVCDAPDPGEDSGLPGADGGDAGPVADGGQGEDGGADGGMDAGTDGGTDVGDAGTALGLERDGLAMGIEGVPYGDRLRARGGTPPYTFTATEALPAGLTLDPEGWLSGAPAAAGEYYLPVDVTDQDVPPKRASGSIPLRVRQRLHVAGPGTLANAVRAGAYVESLSATGGKPPYRFAVAEGSALPSGLELAADGMVTGTSGQVGTVTFTVKVTDDDSPPQVATRELTISTVDLGLGLELMLMTRSVPDGRKGTRYSYTLRSAGGTGATWSVRGNLPPGILFDASQALLSGTPTEADTFTFVITVADLLNSPELQVTLDVK